MRPSVVGGRELVEGLLVARVGLAGLAARAVVEEDPDRRLRLERRERALVGRLLLDRIRRHGHSADPERHLVDDRRAGLDDRRPERAGGSFAT